MNLRRIRIMHAALAVISIASLSLLYLVSVGEFGTEYTLGIFCFTAILVILTYVVTSRSMLGSPKEVASPKPEIEESTEIDEKLAILDEASMFFSASLKPDDMFRLVASRTNEIIPHDAALLFVIEDERLKAKYSAGKESRKLAGIDIGLEKGIAGRALASGNAEFESRLYAESRFYDQEAIKGYNSAAAISLLRAGAPYAVITLFRREGEFLNEERSLLEAVGGKISSLIASSFAFEQSILNSMTDPLTQLPNERAFYVVLENRIAEAIRYPEQRGLTVMAIDIQEFADFNRRYGHSTGDNMLAFAASMIEDQLRKMDMLCRSMNDEFWVVLPTASAEIVEKIKQRIVQRASETPFVTPDDTLFPIEFNFGTSVFQADGETANSLLQVAIVRKKEAKLGDESTVINFPREYLN